jgi:hypothetical protein
VVSVEDEEEEEEEELGLPPAINLAVVTSWVLIAVVLSSLAQHLYDPPVKTFSDALKKMIARTELQLEDRLKISSYLIQIAYATLKPDHDFGVTTQYVVSARFSSNLGGAHPAFSFCSRLCRPFV